MRIKWTAEAETHLDGIYHYIAKDSSLYASRTLDKLTRRAEHLIDYPRVGRIVPKYDDPNLRELIVGSYRVIYRITSDHIEILGCFPRRAAITRLAVAGRTRCSILKLTHDDGKSAINEVKDYAYAQGNPVGETGHGTDTQTNTVKLDTDAYSLVINRVTSGTWTDPSTGTAHSDSCTYDNNGNVLTFTTDASGTAKTTTNTLDEQNHNLTTDTGDQQTTRTYDLSGRMTRMVMNQGGKTYTYDYTYIRRRP